MTPDALHAGMRASHGADAAGRQCGACAFCVSVLRSPRDRRAVKHRVCRKSPEPRRTAHRAGRRPPWKVTWGACGLFQEGSD